MKYFLSIMLSLIGLMINIAFIVKCYEGVGFNLEVICLLSWALCFVFIVIATYIFWFIILIILDFFK